MRLQQYYAPSPRWCQSPRGGTHIHAFSDRPARPCQPAKRADTTHHGVMHVQHQSRMNCVGQQKGLVVHGQLLRAFRTYRLFVVCRIPAQEKWLLSAWAPIGDISHKHCGVKLNAHVLEACEPRLVFSCAPVWVEQDKAVAPDQVDATATCFAAEQKDELTLLFI